MVEFIMPSTRTIISYRPTSEEEGILDALARKLGMSKSRTLAFALKRTADQEKVTAAPVALRPEEMNTIQTLYAELSASYWQRRHGLLTRQQMGNLSESEHTELMQLIEQGEEWNVRRLTYFFELAERYGVSHDYFLDALGLRHHPLAERLS
jgi:hypothetical protein